MWEIFWKHISEEIVLIKSTPLLSAAAFVVAIILAWLALKWRYGKNTESLKQHISFLKDRLEHSTSEKPKQKTVLPPRSAKIQNSKKEPPSRKDEIERILLMLKEVDLERSQLRPEDFLGSALFGPTKGQLLLKKRKDLITQLERMGHPYP